MVRVTGVKITNYKLKIINSGMTRTEFLVVLGILAVIVVASYFNLQKAEVLARDVQRKNDLKHVTAALTDYRKDYQTYPKSENGQILACGEDTDNLIACKWGQGSIGKYISPLPEDPLAPPRRFAYLYISNTRDFQLFAHLERMEDAEYNSAVALRNLNCGASICNFGIASSRDVPVDQDLGEWTKKQDEKTKSDSR